MSTQLDTLLYHLTTTKTITQREALLDHSIQCLTKRIQELRDLGIGIRTVHKRHPLTNQRYAQYQLVG